MIRRSRGFVAAVVSVGLLSACGTTSSSDTIAKVDDAVLTRDELQTVLDNSTPPTSGESVPTTADADQMMDMTAAREVVALWIYDQAISSEARDRGLEVEPLDRSKASLQEIETHAFDGYGALLDDEISDPAIGETARAQYENLVCLDNGQTPDAEAAQEFSDQLNDGADLETASAATAVQASHLGCIDAAQAAEALSQNFPDPAIAEAAPAVAALPPGQASDPISTSVGVVFVFRRLTLDQLEPVNRANVLTQMEIPELNDLLATIVESRDVEVSSLFGTFQLGQGVVPLGITPDPFAQG